MNFLSPWRSRIFVVLVAGVRRLLRPFGRAEDAFIEQLVAVQSQGDGHSLRERFARGELSQLPPLVTITPGYRGH